MQWSGRLQISQKRTEEMIRKQCKNTKIDKGIDTKSSWRRGSVLGAFREGPEKPKTGRFPGSISVPFSRQNRKNAI
jgi:hypothetical protein